jgi:hypothetical protein
MAEEIKTSAFCGLSRSEDFQRWLKSTAEDLHEDLLTVIGSAKGCRANSNKMMDIYFELNDRGLEPHLITFLKRRFPWIIKDNPHPPAPNRVREVKNIRNEQRISQLKSVKDWASLNRHNVFRSYRPDILSFPQKLIIVDHPNNLYDRIQRFVGDKLAVDYLIIEDHAYIEYFDMKYAAVIDKIPRENRDVYLYRLKMRQDAQQNSDLPEE